MHVHICADEIEQLARAHRPARAVLHAGVEILGRDPGLVEHAHAVVQQRDQHTVDDEAGRVGAADRRLAELRAEGEGGLEDVVRRSFCTNDLDEGHQWRRVEEVHADRALRPLEHRGDCGHRQRRGVRREDRVVANDGLEHLEQLVLDREILVRGFDHDVAVPEVRERGRERQPRDRGVARVLLERSLLDLPRQEMRDLIARLLGALQLDLASDRFEARFDCKLCDAGAHCPQADDTDLHRRSTTPAIAIPNPTHIDATP